MRAPHLREHVTNAPPILSFMLLSTLLAFHRLLRSDCASLVSVRAQELPRIIMDLRHLHWGSSPFEGASNAPMKWPLAGPLFLLFSNAMSGTTFLQRLVFEDALGGQGGSSGQAYAP